MTPDTDPDWYARYRREVEFAHYVKTEAVKPGGLISDIAPFRIVKITCSPEHEALFRRHHPDAEIEVIAPKPYRLVFGARQNPMEWKYE
jgi:hypothetical protein